MPRGRRRELRHSTWATDDDLVVPRLDDNLVVDVDPGRLPDCFGIVTRPLSLRAARARQEVWQDSGVLAEQ